MSSQVSIRRLFNLPIHELYSYFTDPRLLESWSAPEGMTLKVPVFEARRGGRYRYEHTSPQGVYVCNGHVRKIEENKMIQMVDDDITDPSGNVVAQKVNCEMTFSSVLTGSEVVIKHDGFSSEKMAKECETGWNECLDKLQELVKNSGSRHLHNKIESRP